MKTRSLGIDDLQQEIQLVLDEDGRIRARALRKLCLLAYRAHRGILLAVLRRPWRRPDFPPLGEELFNLTATELEREWRGR